MFYEEEEKEEGELDFIFDEEVLIILLVRGGWIEVGDVEMMDVKDILEMEEEFLDEVKE